MLVQVLRLSLLLGPTEVQMSALPQTRSGRKVIPPLAWWTGQRLSKDSSVDGVLIENGLPNALLGVDTSLIVETKVRYSQQSKFVYHVPSMLVL